MKVEQVFKMEFLKQYTKKSSTRMRYILQYKNLLKMMLVGMLRNVRLRHSIILMR